MGIVTSKMSASRAKWWMKPTRNYILVEPQMRRKEDRPLQKVTLNLFADDYSKLQALYPRARAAKIIRELIRRHVRDHESQKDRAASDLAIDLDELTEDEGLKITAL
jgi:hypothetical protein